MSAWRAAWASAAVPFTPTRSGTWAWRPGKRRCTFERVVPPPSSHGGPVEERAQDLHRFGQPFLAHGRLVEREAQGSVLGEGMSGADAHLEATIAQVVERCQFLGQQHRVAQVVVQNQGAQPHAPRHPGHGGQRHQG